MTTETPSSRRMLILSGATVVGTVLATMDAFIQPGPWGHAGIAITFIAGGVPAARRALIALWRERSLDVDLLMVVAALAAAFVGAALEGAVLLTLFSVSNMLEQRASAKARKAVEALALLRPDTALRREQSGRTVEVPTKWLVRGDSVVVRPGGRVPVDGVIRDGESALDEATITGESIPVHKRPGQPVFEATINLHGVLTIEVTRTLGESTVARMIALTIEAQAARAPLERFSRWFGQRYTMAVFVGSLVALGVFVWLGWTVDAALYRAATLLVAASPCAIVISVPAATLSALAAAARCGVLFKGGAAMEALAQVKIFAFDKTGTLTNGKAAVDQVVALIPEPEFLALLAGLEAQSEHHLAEAIRRYVADRGIQPAEVLNVSTLPSEGVIGTINGGQVWAGNRRLASRMGATVDVLMLSGFDAGARTVIWLGRGREVLGTLSAADTLRATAVDALADLRAEGTTRIAMMTGDRRPVAQRIGTDLGLSPTDIHADLLPEDKVRLVAELSREGKVAFVGDGVNDAAALARADVGIAMGATGSEVALQAADVALLSEDLRSLTAAHQLARRTQRIIRQNFFFAVGAMVVLVVASLLFALPLPLAVIGHEGGTVLVVLNGLRLLEEPIRSERVSTVH